MRNLAGHTKTANVLLKNEDFERLLVKYTNEGLPAGESLQHFCDRNKVPFNLFDKWYRDTRHKVVKFP